MTPTELVEKKISEAFELANSKLEYYNKQKNRAKVWSKSVRFCSIILIGLGGIFPLIRKVGEIEVSNYGYISIAIAGTLLFLDKFFGFSSGWIRFMTVSLEIQKISSNFRFTIESEILKYTTFSNDLSYENMIHIIGLLRDFINQIDELIRIETQNWATEFQSNISELMKMADTMLESLKPGYVKIIVANMGKAEQIQVALDNINYGELKGTETLLDNIAPGVHKITISAQQGESKIVKTSIVTVEAGKVATAEIKIE